MPGRAVALFLATTLAVMASRAAADEPPPPPARAAADDYDRLGRLEREEIDAVLRENHVEVDREPAGKIIDRVLVSTRPVFSQRDGFLTFFNIFHFTTRERIIRRELLFAGGEAWDQARVDETLRRLRDPLFHNVVVILPLRAADAGRVDVLVVTRDVWSLRLNTRYEVQGTSIINLSFSLSENNLFGLRKRAAVAFLMDQGTIAVGPSYIDPNIGGTRLTLTTLWRLIFAREGGDFEGTRSDTELAYPIWSLRRKWGASLSVAHAVGFERRFLGTGLRTYDAPDTQAVEMLPWMYHRKQVVTEAKVTRAFGTAVRQSVSAGHELDLDRSALLDTFPDDATLRAAFSRDVLPRSELASGLFAAYELYTPVYGAYRDLDTFDFREDYQLGPLVTARASAERTELGSEHDFFRLSAAARWSSGWRGGLYRAAAGISVRVQDGEVIDRNPSLSALAVTPPLGGVVRLLVAAALDVLIDDRSNRFYALGGSNGLRGYAVNEFAGQARALGHVELRTRPLHIEFFRLGAVAFCDVGHAAATLGDLDLHASVGSGLRFLIPQLDPLVIRFDWAFPLEGANRGWPGRVSFGVEQVF